jgi:GxxExxY protein
MQPDMDQEFLYEQETYAIRGACFEVYKEMGPGFLEAVYHECLQKEFISQNIPFIAQQKLSIAYKGEPLVQTYAPDFICYGKIIIEIKGTREISPEHKAQLLNYLKATGMKLGLLVNFGHYPQIQIERMAKTISM